MQTDRCFLAQFSSLILPALFDMATLLTSLFFFNFSLSAALSLGLVLIIFAPISGSSSGRPGATSVYYLPARIHTLSSVACGLLWVSLSDETKGRVETGGGTAHRQVSLTIYLHFALFLDVG